jgi:hypothetical protein
MFVEKDTPKKKEACQPADSMIFLIDDCTCLPSGTATKVGSAEKWNGEELN